MADPVREMKMEIDYIVPLARQAASILRDLNSLTAGRQYVFPSIRKDGRPMSENTINAALRSIGYDGEAMTSHGFRAMARTLLDEELGERVDLIEHQQAHAVKDANGRAYNRTTHLAARREMMQRWADYLDKLRLGDEVVPLRSVGERSGMQLVFLEGIEFSQLLFLAFTQQFPLSSS